MGHTNEEVSDDESFLRAFHITMSCTLTEVLKTTVELKIFDIMASADEQHLSVEEIAAQLQAPSSEAPVTLDRMLRLLASHSVVSCSISEEIQDDGNSRIERRYGLNSVSKLFINDKNGGSFAPYFTMVEDRVQRASWSKLRDAVLEGGMPFNMVHGMNIFEYPRFDSLYNDVFNKAMLGFTTLIMDKILARYQGFEEIKQLVDVGGGLGHCLRAITFKYPSILGINFDLPHVISDAIPYPGVKHVAGDMFESVPRGDAIFLKWILHDWGDNDNIKMLKNCYAALPDNGKVIVVESILSENPETTMVAKSVSQMDVYMLAQTPGGKERTKKEFLTLALAAGFSGINLSCSIAPMWVMEFYK